MRRLAGSLALLCTACIAVPLHPKTGERPIPEDFAERVPHEWVEVPVDGETTLRGIWVPAEGPPVLVLYGSGMSIGRAAELLLILRDAGYSSLCCDYRGVGYSSGRRGFTSRYVDDDARILWEWLLEREGEPAGVIGISLGAVAAAPLLSHPRPPAAAVLDRPVNPRNAIYRWVEANMGVVSSLVSRLFVRTSTDVDMRACLERAKADTLLVLPEYDVLLPPADATKLTRGLPPHVATATVPGGHLSSQLVEPSRWRGAILDFLDARLRQGLPALGGRTFPPGPARVAGWRREGRTLIVTLDRDVERATLLVCGLKGNAMAHFVRPPREVAIRLPRKYRHRVFGVRVLPASYPPPVGTRWITDPPGADRSN